MSTNLQDSLVFLQCNMPLSVAVYVVYLSGVSNIPVFRKVTTIKFQHQIQTNTVLLYISADNIQLHLTKIYFIKCLKTVCNKDTNTFPCPKRPDRLWIPTSLKFGGYRKTCRWEKNGRSVMLKNCVSIHLLSLYTFLARIGTSCNDIVNGAN
jgi:hypothetical protein